MADAHDAEVLLRCRVLRLGPHELDDPTQSDVRHEMKRMAESLTCGRFEIGVPLQRLTDARSVVRDARFQHCDWIFAQLERNETLQEKLDVRFCRSSRRHC